MLRSPEARFKQVYPDEAKAAMPAAAQIDASDERRDSRRAL